MTAVGASEFDGLICPATERTILCKNQAKITSCSLLLRAFVLLSSLSKKLGKLVNSFLIQRKLKARKNFFRLSLA